jgi:hypothetical protein
MRSSYCLCILPIFFNFLCSPCRVKDDSEISLLSTQILTFRLHTFSLPKPSEQCLGTFNTGDTNNISCPPKCNILTNLQFLFYISLSLALCMPLPNFFIFCAVGVVSKESRLLVLHRTYKIILPYRLLLSSYIFLSDFKILYPLITYMCALCEIIFYQSDQCSCTWAYECSILSSDVTAAILL